MRWRLSRDIIALPVTVSSMALYSTQPEMLATVLQRGTEINYPGKKKREKESSDHDGAFGFPFSVGKEK